MASKKWQDSGKKPIKITSCKRYSKLCCDLQRESAEIKARRQARGYLRNIYGKGMNIHGELNIIGHVY